MIPISTWEFVKKRVYNLKAQRLEQLNKERKASQVRSKTDKILSNISLKDIRTIIKSIIPELSILSCNLSPTSESKMLFCNFQGIF
jgi:hypothetical protein